MVSLRRGTRLGYGHEERVEYANLAASSRSRIARRSVAVTCALHERIGALGYAPAWASRLPVLWCTLPVALVAASFMAPVGGAALKTPPKCPTSGLVVWVDTNGDGAAGSIYYTLEFTNLSGSSCTLTGYPGVSAVGLNGHQLGERRGHDPATAAHTVTLANGATKTATLRIVEAGNFPSAQCHMTEAAGLRASIRRTRRPPAKLVPFLRSTPAKHTGPVVLMVRSREPARPHEPAFIGKHLTACTRFLASWKLLQDARWTCVFVVCSLTTSRGGDLGVREDRRTTRPAGATSSSREVRPFERGRRPRGLRLLGEPPRSASLLTDGANSDPPSATMRIAATSSCSFASLSRNALAPARSDS